MPRTETSSLLSTDPGRNLTKNVDDTTIFLSTRRRCLDRCKSIFHSERPAQRTQDGGRPVLSRDEGRDLVVDWRMHERRIFGKHTGNLLLSSRLVGARVRRSAHRPHEAVVASAKRLRDLGCISPRLCRINMMTSDGHELVERREGRRVVVEGQDRSPVKRVHRRKDVSFPNSNFATSPDSSSIILISPRPQHSLASLSPMPSNTVAHVLLWQSETDPPLLYLLDMLGRR